MKILMKKDEEEAMHLYLRYAEQGNEAALFLLGTKYEEGNGVTKSTNEAYRYFKKAADGGSERAKTKLELLRKSDASNSFRANPFSLSPGK